MARARQGWLLLALALCLCGTSGVSRAAGRTPALAGAAGANILVEPYLASSLWFLTLDPALVYMYPDTDVLPKIYAGLLKWVFDHKTGKVVVAPDLAASLPRVSKNGLVYTLTLRPDAGFSDGTPVTAQDVVYTINRALAPAEKSSWAASYFAPVAGCAAVAAGKAQGCRGVIALDAHTVQITLLRPMAAFPFLLNIGIVKHGLPIGAHLTTNPSLIVGAGPFMVKGASWQYRHQVTLVPNPRFYNARNMKLKEIQLVFTGSLESAFAGYRGGQFPLAFLPAVEVARYRGTPEFHQSVNLGISALSMNVKVPPFTNRHFRRAVAFAINREAIVKGVLRGTSSPLYSWYPRGMLGYDPAAQQQGPHYNPAMARHELALARQELGRLPASITLTGTNEVDDWVRMYEQIQRDLKAVGITLRLHLMSGMAWGAAVPQGKTAFYQTGWGPDYPDPQGFSDNYLATGGPFNWMNYSNRTVDALFARAAATADPVRREQLYKQAQLIVLNDAPVVVTNQMALQMVISTKIHGLEVNPILGEVPHPVDNDWTRVSVLP
jgi:ABC-type transport system substrate-binding protein